MADDVMLHEAIEAVAQGQRGRARDLLTRLLRSDQANPTYWLWMSSVVDSSKERVFCLQNALRLDPGSQAAKLGLVLHGSIPPPDDLTPSPPIRRKWSIAEAEGPQLTGIQKVLQNKTLRALALAGIGVLTAGLLLVGFLGPRLVPSMFAGNLQLTITPKPWTAAPTATLLPTNTPWAVTPSPSFTGPMPLWMLLEATYTATPLYVDTPHPISEAYRAGLRAMSDSDFNEMLLYMKQAAQVDPLSPDTHYYVGEAYRFLGDYELALEYYTQAITTDPNFAPAYLSRARIQKAMNPATEIQDDLDKAIEADPNLAEAYIERVKYWLAQGEFEAALQDLHILENLSPESPFLYLYLAQANLALGKNETALESAQIAYNLDQTILPVYLTLGEAYLRIGNPQDARHYLMTYTRYDANNALAWANLGRAYYEAGHQREAAIEAFNKALELQEDLFLAYLYRGLTYLELEEGQSAVNDLFYARNFDRQSFAASFGLGRALLLSGRNEDAVHQISSSQNLATTDNQLAEVYYWRAKAQEALGAYIAAAQDWNALLDLSPEVVPQEWLSFAQDHLAALTPEPTVTQTFRPKTPTLTRTATQTLPSRTPSPSPSRIPTRTPTPPRKTSTPTLTPTPAP